MITTVQDINIAEILEPLHLKSDDEISIEQTQGQIIIKKVNYTPNEETLRAIEENKKAWYEMKIQSYKKNGKKLYKFKNSSK